MPCRSTGAVLNFSLFQGLCSARPRSPTDATPSAPLITLHLVGLRCGLASIYPTPPPTTSNAAPLLVSDQQATAAFNFLQDRLGKPHAKRVWYDPGTDSYSWIGPKFGKKMSMPRSQFYFRTRTWFGDTRVLIVIGLVLFSVCFVELLSLFTASSSDLIQSRCIQLTNRV
jgi:hypothetical protein